MPTKYAEGLSRVALEAVANNIPIIMAINRGTEGIIEASYKYYMENCTPTMIATKIGMMIGDKEHFPELPKEYGDRVIDKYGEQESVRIFFEGLQ